MPEQKREEHRKVRETVVKPTNPARKAHLRKAHTRRVNVNVDNNSVKHASEGLQSATQQLMSEMPTVSAKKYSKELGPVLDHLISTIETKWDFESERPTMICDQTFFGPPVHGVAEERAFEGFTGENVFRMYKAAFAMQSEYPETSISRRWGTQEDWLSVGKNIKPDQLDKGVELIEDESISPKTFVYNETQLVDSEVASLPRKDMRTEKTDAMISALDRVGVERLVGFLNGYLRTEDPFFKSMNDTIHLVNEEYFIDSMAFVHAYAHELAHASGRPSRLNRPAKTDPSDEEYCKEELVAELAATIVVRKLFEQTSSLDGEPEIPEYLAKRSALYIYHYMEDDHKELKHLQWAIDEAEKAADWILERALPD